MATAPMSLRRLHLLCKQLHACSLSRHLTRAAENSSFGGALLDKSCDANERVAECGEAGSIPDSTASVSGWQFSEWATRQGKFRWQDSVVPSGCRGLRVGWSSKIGCREAVSGRSSWEGNGTRGYTTKLWKFTRKRLYGAPLAYLDPEKHPLDQPVPTSSPNRGSIQARGRKRRRRNQQQMAFKAWCKTKMEEVCRDRKQTLHLERQARQKAAAERHRTQLLKAAGEH